MSYSLDTSMVMTHARVKQIREHMKGYHKVWTLIVTGKFGFDVSRHTKEWWQSVKNRDHIAISFVSFRINKHYHQYDVDDHVPTEWLDDIKMRMFEVNQVHLSYLKL